MARKGSRKSGKGKGGKLGIFGRIYSPLNHLLMATRNVSKSVFSRSGKVVDNGLGLVSNAGKSLVKHADMTVRNVTRRKDRKHRKASRRNRK